MYLILPVELQRDRLPPLTVPKPTNLPLSTSPDPLSHGNIHSVVALVDSGATNCFVHQYVV